MEQIKQLKHCPAGQGRNKMPAWLLQKDCYQPGHSTENFLNKTLLSIIAKMIIFRENAIGSKKSFVSASFKFFFVLLLIFLISLARSLLFLLIVLAVVLIYLCFLSGHRLLAILKPALAAALFCLLIMLPAAFWGMSSLWVLPFKVFLTTVIVALLAYNTPFYLLTKAMGGMHIPGLFIMAIDIAVRYIALLGNTAYELLIALKLRSVGKNKRKYQSLGGIMGMTFIKSQEYAAETYNAMLCRCFTGEYHVAQQHHFQKKHVLYVLVTLFLLITFLYTEGYLATWFH